MVRVSEVSEVFGVPIDGGEEGNLRRKQALYLLTKLRLYLGVYSPGRTRIFRLN
jgi:hypothetical protein